MVRLEKYKGGKTRYTCPNCNEKKEFTRYQNDEGNYFADDVGKCNRSSKCGYHYTPKQFFADNPELRRDAKKNFLAKRKSGKFKTQTPAPTKTDFIDADILTATLIDYEDNNFVQFLSDLFPDDSALVIDAVRRYFIGTWQKNRTVFWQIDKNRKIRTGKLISYNASTGKRDKAVNPSYIHAELKRSGKVPNDFQLGQCFFGEHLINERGKTIAIVEAEKTAVIASILFPDKIWLAAGAKSYLKVEKLEKLRDRNIILYPDADAFEGWNQIADEAQSAGLNVKVSTIIETNGSEAEKENGWDIADYLIELQKRKNKLKGRSYLLEFLPDEILDDEKLLNDFVDIFEERIAILEFVEELSNEEAEKAAIQNESFERIISSVLPK